MSHLSNRHSWFRVPRPTPADQDDYYLVCERCNRECSREECWTVPRNCIEHVRPDRQSSANVGYATVKSKIGVR
jgi:hypothetical protein